LKISQSYNLKKKSLFILFSNTLYLFLFIILKSFDTSILRSSLLIACWLGFWNEILRVWIYLSTPLWKKLKKMLSVDIQHTQVNPQLEQGSYPWIPKSFYPGIFAHCPIYAWILSLRSKTLSWDLYKSPFRFTYPFHVHISLSCAFTPFIMHV
jgi:hypothetical protein